MANLIGIMGPSGFGKTTSLLPNKKFGIEGLDPKETFIINVTGKLLPGKGSMKLFPIDDRKLSEGKNHIILSSADEIASLCKAIDATPAVKNLIIDDAGYIMGFDVIDNIKRKGYDKWSDLASNFMKVINTLKAARIDLNVILMFHTEVGKDERIKIKTAGAMIDNTIYLDGLFTVILESDVIKDGDAIKYVFRTQGGGISTCKSPAGMFEEMFIPNDMGLVLKTIHEYYYGENE